MMKGRTAVLLIAVTVAMLIPELTLSEEHPEYTAVTRVTMDYFSTVSMLTVYDDFSQPGRTEKLDQTWSEVCALLGEIDAALSASDSDSDVYRFNMLSSGESIKISAHTQTVLAEAKDVYDLSGGAYDPTVSRLVDLYGFSPRFTAGGRIPVSQPYDRERNLFGQSFAPPDEAYVEAFQALVSLPAISVDGATLAKLSKPVRVNGITYEQTIDLGGIGKGYAVDRVVELLREHGYAYGYFSCGGSSVGVLQRATASKGAVEPAQWGVAIAKPRYATANDQTLMRVFLRDGMLSTSGDYEHAYTYNGVRYCHLIDPATGRPINMPRDQIQSGICSVTVFGNSAAMCDALSTALCAMGLQRALELMNTPELSDYHFVMVLYSDANRACEIVTNLSPSEYELLDGEMYHLACKSDGDTVTYTGELLAPLD